MPKNSKKTRNFYFWLALLSLAGLLLRLLVCRDLLMLEELEAPPDGTDMATYFAFARDILNGQWPPAFYFQPFYYSVFLPLSLVLSAGKTWGPAILQAFLGTATIWLVGLCTARLFGRRAALVAALLLALARFHIFYTPFLLMTVLQSFWMILLLYLSIRAYDRNRWVDWVLLALCFSAAILTRGNALLFLPLILGLMVWRNRSRKQNALIMTGVFMIVMYLPQLPFALKNLNHYQRWTGPSSAADAVLALGNTPEAPPGGLSYTRSYKAWMEEAGKSPEGRTPVARNILGWIRREPLAYLELKLRMLLLYWDRREIPNNVNFPAFRDSSPVLNLPVLFGFGIIAPLAILGMIAVRYKGKPLRIFALGMVGMYCLATVLFYILARFRLPAVPLLCVFGGAGVQTGCLRLTGVLQKKKSWRQAVPVGAACACGIIIVWLLYPMYETRWGPAILRWVRPNGTYVPFEKNVFVADYGSPAPFGWFHYNFSTEPVRVVKTILLPQDRQTGLDLTSMTVDAAFFGAPGSQVEFVFPAADGQFEAVPLVFPEPSGNGAQWLPLPWSMEPGSEEIFTGFSVRVVRGRLSVAVDRTRNYRRSLIAREGEELLPIRGEVVVRVIIPRDNREGEDN